MNNYNLMRLLSNYNLKKKKIIYPKRIYPLKIEKTFINNLKIRSLSKLKIKLPSKIDLRSKFQSVYDQGNLGSCTANALCGVIGFINPLILGSRLFVYYNERMIADSITYDAGATLEDGIKSLQIYGVCQELEWVYDISKFTIKPPEKCYINALNNIVTQVNNINNDIFSMKNSLFNKQPFVVGIAIYSSFESYSVAKTGKVSIPVRHKEKFLGGHAVVCVGYDDNKKVWIMRNSWGNKWGDKGYFYLPYTYLINPLLSTDIWTIEKIN
jgi:C1A family cysteine protease